MKTRLVIMIGLGLMTAASIAQRQPIPDARMAVEMPSYRRIRVDTWVTALNGINDSGMIIGTGLAPPDYFYEYGIRLAPRIKNNGVQYKHTDMQMFTEINNNRPFSLNNRGVVVGQTCRPVCRATLWLKNGITEVDLGMGPLGIRSHAYAVNDAGWVLLKNHSSDVCSVLVPADTTGDGTGDTWFRDADGDGYNDLLIPITAELTPCAINETGQIVFAEGILLNVDPNDTDGDQDPWFADEDGDGINDQLHVLTSLGDSIQACDINDAGQVVGESAGRPVLWEFIDGVEMVIELELPIAGEGTGMATAINNNGQIVGLFSKSGSKRKEGFLLHEGTVYPLNELMTDGTLMHPDGIDINNRGWIIEFEKKLFSTVAIPQL